MTLLAALQKCRLSVLSVCHTLDTLYKKIAAAGRKVSRLILLPLQA